MDMGTVEKTKDPPCELEFAFQTPNEFKIANLKLNLEVKAEIIAYGTKIGIQPGRCAWSFYLIQAPSYKAILMLNRRYCIETKYGP